ncbi:MAG TPA: kelch repeat-containing protein [Marmoricola sp.]|nr:kelch repeat-containing protein [Marmoricola sp.]
MRCSASRHGPTGCGSSPTCRGLSATRRSPSWAVAVLGRRILLAGGRTGPDTLTSRMWWFDPHTHRFTPAGRLPHRLADTAVVQGRDRAWLVGGETPRSSNRVLEVARAG